MADSASQTRILTVPSVQEIGTGLEKLIGRSEEQNAFIDAMKL